MVLIGGIGIGAGGTIGGFTVVGAGGDCIGWPIAGVEQSAGAHELSLQFAPHAGVNSPNSRSNNRGRTGRASHPTVGHSDRLSSGMYCTRGRHAGAGQSVADNRDTGIATVPQFPPPIAGAHRPIEPPPLAHAPPAHPSVAGHGKYARIGARYGTGLHAKPPGDER